MNFAVTPNVDLNHNEKSGKINIKQVKNIKLQMAQENLCLTDECLLLL